jgi:hypothetical protein
LCRSPPCMILQETSLFLFSNDKWSDWRTGESVCRIK